jgi:hypothetical protein
MWAECPQCGSWTRRASGAWTQCPICGADRPPRRVAGDEAGLFLKAPARPYEIWIQPTPNSPWWRTIGAYHYEGNALKVVDITLANTRAARAAVVDTRTQTILRLVQARGVPVISVEAAQRIPVDRDAVVSRWVPLPAVQQDPGRAVADQLVPPATASAARRRGR